MPEFISRLVEWFQARSTVQKALIVIGALVVLAVVSPLAVFIAAVVLLISLVVLGLRMVRRGPLRGPAIVAAVALVAVGLFSGISAAFYGGDQPQETTEIQEAAEEEPVAEPEPEPEEQPEPEPVEEPEPEPEPPTPEQDVQALLEDQFDDGQLRKVEVVEQAGGGYGVLVDFDGADNFSNSMIKDGMEIDMREAYEALYTEAEVDVRTATMTAYFPMMDQMGNETEDPVYQTELDRETAEQVNWENAVALEWDNIWEVTLLHPEFQE